MALNSCNLNGDLLEALKTAIENHSQLRDLYLFANKIDQSGAPFIADIIKNKLQLQTLGLSNNKLYKYGAMEIAKTGLTGK